MAFICDLVRQLIIQTGSPVLDVLDSAELVYCIDLPHKFDAEVAPAILIREEAGEPLSLEIKEITVARVDIRMVAGVRKYQEARELYNAVKSYCHGKTKIDFGEDGHILQCVEVIPLQDMTDPDNGWYTPFGTWNVTAR